MLNKISNFLNEVKVELGKVSWPGKEELIGSTTVVIICTIIITIFIGICDFIFSKAAQIIIK